MTGAECDVCTYAAVHQSWPSALDGTHCRSCHRSWSSTTEAHCRAALGDGTLCCAHFSSNPAADKHWVLGRHQDMRHVVSDLVQDSVGMWTTVGDIEKKDRMRDIRQRRKSA